MTLSDAIANLINAVACFISKIQSGRCILTIVGAICFYLFTDMICTILRAKMMDMSIDDITKILLPIITSLIVVISNVFTFYFLKGTDGNPGTGTTNGNGNGDTVTVDTTTLKA